MKKIFLCSNCHGDKVQTKMWVEINTKIVDDLCSDAEEADNYCPYCNKHVQTYLAEVVDDFRVVGFQVVGKDNTENAGEIHPDMDASFCLYSLSQAQKMLGRDFKWRLLTVYDGDIEEPTFMFKGDPLL